LKNNNLILKKLQAELDKIKHINPLKQLRVKQNDSKSYIKTITNITD